MITIKTIASGSTGNCYRISDGITDIMIECGIRFREIQEAFDFELSCASGCLVTHEHQDHCKAVKQIIKAGINCFMSGGTAEALSLSGHRIKVQKPLEIFTVGTFKILPFPTQHDCAEPFGYLLQSKAGEKLLFITDSFYCKYKFQGINYYMVECNYSTKIIEENIKSGLVPEAIRNRIVKSHFELENVKEFFRANDTSKVNEIHLIHMSGNNSDIELFKSEIQAVTGKPVYIFGGKDQ